MNKSRKCRRAPPDLVAVLTLVAGSTIKAVPARQPEKIFSDWQAARKSADIDALVLAWIASHVRGPLHRGRLN